MEAFGSTAQNGSIPRLQAQSTSIRCYVRTRFIDDPDDAERNAYALNLQTVWTIPFRQDRAYGIVQLGNILEPLGHAFDPRIIE